MVETKRKLQQVIILGKNKKSPTAMCKEVQKRGLKVQLEFVKKMGSSTQRRCRRLKDLVLDLLHAN